MVTQKMVSAATASDHWGMLKAGSLDLKCFLIGNHVEVMAHLAVNLKVFSMVAVLTQPKQGHRWLKSMGDGVVTCWI